MKDFPFQYYETFPLHPQPIPMEAFTSYLSRLAQANGMEVVDIFLIASFPDKFLKYRLKEGFQALVGSSVISFGTLSKLACCSEEVLRATTFIHLGRKFGHFSHARAIDLFLHDSIAPYLRYCPACWVESRDPYYSLLWQFVWLHGCVQHGCRLLDCCGYCGQVLPLLPGKHAIAICSRCEGHLTKLTSPQLSNEEMGRVQRWTQELEFLLTPYEQENVEDVEKRVGQQYAHLRRMKGLTVSDVASHLQVSSHMLYSLEKGKKGGGRGTTLKSYLMYAEYLGLSFKDLYIVALSREDYSHIREDEQLLRAKDAIESLKVAGVSITYGLVAQTMGVSTSSLRRFSTAKALVDSFIKEQIQNRKTLKFQQYQEIVINKAKEAIKRLNEIGDPITLRGIADITKLSRKTLRKYLRETDLHEELMQAYYQDGTKRFKKRERELFQEVQVALQELEALQNPISLKTISEMISITPASLYHYPSIRLLLMQNLQSPNRNLSRDEDLVARASEAIEKLVLNGELVGYRTIGEILGVSPKILQRTLATRELLEAVRQDSLNFQKAEAMMLKGIFAAIEELETRSELVGYLSVSKVIGISSTVLQRSVRAREIIQKAIEKQQEDLQVEKRVMDAIDYLLENGCDIKYEQISQRTGVPREVWWTISNVKKRLEELAVLPEYEKELLKQVQDAIRMIELREEPVTLSKIWRTAHLSPKTIKGYPRIEKILEPYKKTYHTIRKQHSQQREEELVVQVQSTIREMQVLDQPFSRRQVSEKVGLSPSTLKQYPRVDTLLKQVTTDRLQRQSLKHQQREAELVKLLQDTIKEIEALGEPVTKKAVLQRITVSLTTLSSYPQVKTVWNRLSRKNPFG